MSKRLRISVEDGLPSVTDNYMVYPYDGKIAKFNANEDDIFYGLWTIKDRDGFDYDISHKVTHWQPITSQE